MTTVLNIDRLGYGTKSVTYDFGIIILGYDDTYVFISDIEDQSISII